jgi:hypothetical protein
MAKRAWGKIGPAGRHVEREVDGRWYGRRVR